MPRIAILRVEQLLMMHWDPVGIFDAPEAADEYRTYAAAIGEMLVQGRAMSEIADYLLAVEREQINLPGDPRRAQATAQALLALR